ncbi:MAG TPA: PQQ-binding-like beta-propeller repeat protein [Steroidobacteraceae bacterium]|nr:PQQ-binding-like beta-propeller repeat protein [Steroidobacteraceae bacterium]
MGFGNRAFGLLVMLALATGACAAPQQDAARTGEAIYRRACAMCHDHAEALRAPTLATLKAMRYQQVYYALTVGKMRAQGQTLTGSERSELIDFLIGRARVSDAWTAPMRCAPGRRKVDLGMSATVAGFGYDLQNHRHLTAAQAGIGTADFRHLELAWALAFPRATTMRAQAAVVGSTLFLPVADAAQLYAIDIAERPCLKWIYRSDVPLRTGVGYGALPGSGRKVLVFADVGTRIHMVDAATGAPLWKHAVHLTSLSNTTGTPVLLGGRVYVPLSASEINVGADPKHLCCTTHGAVIALDARTGEEIWTAHTMPDAKPVRDRGDGQMMWGPSGAPIWTSPAIDEQRGVLYVGTGEATSAPAAPTTDSVLAIDLASGAIRWRFQATADDIFLTGCLVKQGLNCPHEGRLLDHDFGASIVLARTASGHDVVLAGQKSGTLYALDPDAQGRLLWQRSFGAGSIIGGIHWGLAFDGARVFVPMNTFPGPDGRDPGEVAGLHAVAVDTGTVLWSYYPQPDCSGGRQARVRTCATVTGMTGAPAVIAGAVVEGSADGFLRAFDANTGELLFQFDTTQPITTANGVPGIGGALDNASIVAARGYLFVNSGYGIIGGETPGNLFLAFHVKAH